MKKDPTRRPKNLARLNFDEERCNHSTSAKEQRGDKTNKTRQTQNERPLKKLKSGSSQMKLINAPLS